MHVDYVYYSVIISIYIWARLMCQAHVVSEAGNHMRAGLGVGVQLVHKPPLMV